MVMLYKTSKKIYGMDLFESVGLFFFVTEIMTRILLHYWRLSSSNKGTHLFVSVEALVAGKIQTR